MQKLVYCTSRFEVSTHSGIRLSLNPRSPVYWLYLEASYSGSLCISYLIGEVDVIIEPTLTVNMRKGLIHVCVTFRSASVLFIYLSLFLSSVFLTLEGDRPENEDLLYVVHYWISCP